MVEKKKRGRKPRGGKIMLKPKKTPPSHELCANIILHLKCSTKDINSNDPMISSLSYTPSVNDIESYQLSKNTLDYGNIEMTKKKTEKKEKKVQAIFWGKIKKMKNDMHYDESCDKRSSCFWCTETFSNIPFYIPKKNRNNKIESYGHFCTAECATAFLFGEKIDSSIIWERYTMLNNLYPCAYKFKRRINPAPAPHYLLEKFFGTLTIEEYRNMIKDKNATTLILDKPLTQIMPEMHQNNNFEPNFRINLLNEKPSENQGFNLKSKIKRLDKQEIVLNNFNL